MRSLCDFEKFTEMECAKTGKTGNFGKNASFGGSLVEYSTPRETSMDLEKNFFQKYDISHFSEKKFIEIELQSWGGGLMELVGNH